MTVILVFKVCVLDVKGNILFLFLVVKINLKMKKKMRKKNEFYESIYNCDELPNVTVLIFNVDLIILN